MSNIEVFKNLQNKLLSCLATEEKVFRATAFSAFEAHGLPTKANEAWKYTSLKPIQNQWNLAPIKTVKTETLENEITVSCVNGFFDTEKVRSDLASYNVEILSFSQALDENKIEQLTSRDAFSALNSAFFENGLYVSVPPKTEIKKPIVIRHIITDAKAFINPKIYIKIGEDSSVELADIFEIETEEYLLNSSMQLIVGNRASVKLLKDYSEPYLSSHIDSILVTQSDSSSFQFIQSSSGSQLLRQNFEVSVVGKNASTDLRGITILKKQSQMDNFVKIHHIAPESTSRQSFKSVLKDQSHYVFQGNIRIEKDAQKTDSDQVNRNLMLGPKCHVDTKPQIDVFADDVKATHGAAIGQLNSDERFYLESRALSPDQALALLYQGFAFDLLEGLKSKWSEKYLREKIERNI